MFSVAVMEPGQVRLTNVPKPEPGPYQVRIRTEAACLCNATDRKLIDGHFPGMDRYPLLLGHESVGIVESVGPMVRSIILGDRVIGGLLLDVTDPVYASGWGGFSEFVIAGDHLAMKQDGVADPEHQWYEVYEIMRVIPPEIPIEAAVLLCTWREVYAAFVDFNLQAGQDVLIYGAGPVGLSFTRMARLLGLDYIGVVEFSEMKRELARQFGASDTFSPEDHRLYELVKSRGRPLDAVIDAVGKEAIINSALPLVKMGGSICVYGVIDQAAIQVQKNRGPYNFNLLFHQWPTRSREAAAQEPLCEWIAQGKLDYQDFISAEFSIYEINQAIELTRTGKTIKTLLRF